MRIYSVTWITGCLIVAAALSAAAPLSAAGRNDSIRQVIVSRSEPLSSPAMRLDTKSQAIKDKFLTDTVQTRRLLAGKLAALRAVYSVGPGDTATASRLGEEIFDLREQLRVKAQATGMSPALLLDWNEMGYSEQN